MKTKNITQISLFVALTVICAQISLPFGVIPFTLQTFAFFLSAAVLGFKNGIICNLIYLFLGIVGLPVFSGFRGGIGIIFGPTGGYLWGFLVSSAVIGLIADRCKKSLIITFLSMILGLSLCYIIGILQYTLLYTDGIGGFKAAFITCVLPFIPTDAVKIFLAATICKKIKNIL